MSEICATPTTSRKTTASKPDTSNSNSGSSFIVKEESHSRDAIARLPIVEMTADRIVEYQWPEGSTEYFFLQEQITEFLGIKSFKRKYPDFFRRQLSVEERIFLKDHGLIGTLQSDLGLTALRSDDVMELMANEYPTKYAEYLTAVENRQQAAYTHKVSAGYQQPTIDKSKMGEFIRKTIKSVSEYNQQINQERKEERRASMDLQTYIMHYPVGLGKENRQLVSNIRKGRVRTRRGRFPVALYPWQYQDWYMKYTSEELKYFPINTVLYGPVVTDPNKLPPLLTAAEESDSDSDSALSDDDAASCCSSKSRERSASPRKEGDGPSAAKRPRRSRHNNAPSESSSSDSSSSDSEVDGPPPAPVLMKELGRGQLNATCKVCGGTRLYNKQKEPEELVHCSDCERSSHPSCLELTAEMVDVIKSYPWQCSDCKTCITCGNAHEEDKMMFCDKCDRGYHTFCVGLKSIPIGKWVCRLCAQCAQCGKSESLETTLLHYSCVILCETLFVVLRNNNNNFEFRTVIDNLTRVMLFASPGATTPVPNGNDQEAASQQWQHETIKISLNGDTLRRHQLFCQNCYKQRRK